jgi:hypothetical protein
MPAKRVKEQDTNLFSLKFWVAVMKELGILAFIVFFLAMIFLFFASNEQKSAFIDKFFLFQDVNKNPFPFSFVIAGLILVIILQYLYFKRILSIKEDANKRLGEEKSDLQSRLLNKRLNSSNNKGS